MSNSTSVGEIVGVVIIIVVFLALGMVVCGCGSLPQPTEVAAARWRERKEQREARRAERLRERETQLPLYRTPSRTRNRAITFADDVGRSVNPHDPIVQTQLPSPPPLVASRDRSPVTVGFTQAGLPKSDGASISSRDSSTREDQSPVGEEKGQGNECRPDNKSQSASELISGEDAVPYTISIPSPIYSDAVTKE